MSTSTAHSRHQEMLHQHHLNKEARLDRRDRHDPKTFKVDSEQLGFKAQTLPLAHDRGQAIFSSQGARLAAVNYAIKNKLGKYALPT